MPADTQLYADIFIKEIALSLAPPYSSEEPGIRLPMLARHAVGPKGGIANSIGAQEDRAVGGRWSRLGLRPRCLKC
jgi:hypothetical protein